MDIAGVYLLAVVAALFQVGHQHYVSHGVISQPHFFPSGQPHVSNYLVLIIRDHDWHKKCGGVLVSDSYVLTAAECVDCETALLIMGAYDVLSYEKTQIRQTITQKDIILYDYFDPRTKDHNIVLIRLHKKVKLTHFVNTVAIPDHHLRLEPGSKLQLTGWEHSLTRYSNIASQVELILISQDKCRSYWPAGRISDDKVCALNNQRTQIPHLLGSNCIRDPGSPLTLHGKPDKLIGLLTGDITCGTMLPKTFTYVPRYKKWIDSIVGHGHEEIEVVVEKQVEVIGGSAGVYT